MRLLSESSKSFGLEELGIWGKALECVQDSLRKPSGMTLITGPTGSGKTTTLYSMMEILNKPEVNISTIEILLNIKCLELIKRNTKTDIGLTFAAGLRSLVRQDPDIIMVGEIRDQETAEIAVHAAMTGHLVLSTIHTNDAATTMPRLAKMGVPSFLISSTFNVIVAQRLVRRICDHCREEFDPPVDLKNRIQKVIEELPESSFMEK